MAQRSCGSQKASAIPDGTRVRLSGTGRSDLASRVLRRDLARANYFDELEIRERDGLDGFPLVVRTCPRGAVRPRALVDRHGASDRHRRIPAGVDVRLCATHETNQIAVHPHAPNTPMCCLLVEHTSRRLEGNCVLKKVKDGAACTTPSSTLERCSVSSAL